MELKVKSGMLKEMFSSVEPVITNNSIMDILKYVLLDVKDKKIKLAGTNLEQSVEISTDIDIDGEFKVCLPFDKVNTIVKSFPDDNEISIKVEDNKVVLINKKNRYSFGVGDVEDFPVRQKTQYKEFFSISGSSIRQVGKRFSYVIDKKDARPHFTGMLINVMENGVDFVGTDGKQLLVDTYTIENDIETKSIEKALMPYNSLKYLQSIISENAVFFISENSISIIHKKIVNDKEYNISFETQQIEGVNDYPDYNRVLPKEINATMRFNVKEFKQVVSRFGALTSGFGFPKVNIVVKDNDFMLNTTQEGASIEEHIIPIESNGEMEFALSIEALNTTINVFSSMVNEVKLQFSESNRPIIITPENAESIKYITMPLK